MNEHVHDIIVQLDGEAKCRICGESPREEEIAIVTSYRRANRILEEIAVAGHYRATTFERGFVVYAIERGSNREEVTAQKLSNRTYRIIKRFVDVEEV